MEYLQGTKMPDIRPCDCTDHSDRPSSIACSACLSHAFGCAIATPCLCWHACAHACLVVRVGGGMQERRVSAGAARGSACVEERRGQHATHAAPDPAAPDGHMRCRHRWKRRGGAHHRVALPRRACAQDVSPGATLSAYLCAPVPSPTCTHPCVAAIPSSGVVGHAHVCLVWMPQSAMPQWQLPSMLPPAPQRYPD